MPVVGLRMASLLSLAAYTNIYQELESTWAKMLEHSKGERSSSYNQGKGHNFHTTCNDPLMNLRLFTQGVTGFGKRDLIAQIMIFLYRRFSATTPKNNSRDKTFVFVSEVSPTLCLHSC